MTDLRCIKVEIVLMNEKNETTSIVWNAESQQWNMNGPVYPRHIVSMNSFNEFLMREKSKI